MTRAWSNQPPPRYAVIHEAGAEMCTVVLYTDVRIVAMPDGDTAYRATVLRITARHKPNILEDVRDHYTEWLTMAAETDCRKEGVGCA